MSVATENKQLLLEHTSEILDPVLAPIGFRRRDRSLTYSRSFPDTKQEFNLFFDSSPRYATHAKMHLLPTIQVRMPEVGVVASQMAGDHRLLANAPDVIVSHQIQNLAPKSEHQRWFISDPNSCRVALNDVAGVFNQWVEPFLQDYNSPDCLLLQYEAGDKRPIQTHQFYVFVAASYILRDQKDTARQVLESHLGKPGLKKMYAKAFAFVA